jgi:hypothetical protein
MKRIAILSVALMLSMMAATAQNKVGEFSLKPMVGISVSDISTDEEFDYSVKVGLAEGVEVECGVTPWLGVSLGAIYSQQGAKFDAISKGIGGVTPEGQKVVALMQLNGRLKADYINAPLLANFYVWKGLSIKTGVQVGFLVSDEMVGTGYFIGTEVTDPNKGTYTDLTDPGNPNYYSESIDRPDICKSVVFGIPVGLSYEYKNITLDARYYFGLTRMDDAKEDPAARNRCLSITLGYKFKLK